MASRATAKRQYLDLSKDPVQPRGISATQAAELRAQGWDAAPLSADAFAHVQFKDKSSGVYYRDGWVKKGTVVWSTRAVSVFEDFEMVGGCGNVMVRPR